VLFAIVLVLCLQDDEPMTMVGLCLLFLGIPTLYSSYAYLSCLVKAKNAEPLMGTVSGFTVSEHPRSMVRWASVSLQHNGKKYVSPTQFQEQEAEAMVGKKVSFLLLDGKLCILDIFG